MNTIKFALNSEDFTFSSADLEYWIGSPIRQVKVDFNRPEVAEAAFDMLVEKAYLDPKTTSLIDQMNSRQFAECFTIVN